MHKRLVICMNIFSLQTISSCLSMMKRVSHMPPQVKRVPKSGLADQLSFVDLEHKLWPITSSPAQPTRARVLQVLNPGRDLEASRFRDPYNLMLQYSVLFCGTNCCALRGNALLILPFSV